MNEQVFIDGDFPTDTQCEHHCSPSCHPAQIGPEWVYGCLHNAWPQNRDGDFCPIVECGGDPAKCEIPPRLIKNILNGRRRRHLNLVKKLSAVDAEIDELRSLLKKREATDDDHT